MLFPASAIITLILIYYSSGLISLILFILFLFFDFILKITTIKHTSFLIYILTICFSILTWVTCKLMTQSTVQFLGLSFILFRSLSVTSELYYSKKKFNLYLYLYYMLYFPTFFSGPLLDYSNFIKQTNEISFSRRIFPVSIFLDIIQGLVLKLFFSNVFFYIIYHLNQKNHSYAY
jgi:D-alanyl-lipoteichoic acid acyltransferase DltB (MBOAT superfamily)